MERGSVVVVGTGHAGFQVAASLRKNGFAGEVTLVGDEAGLPYQRPPLSKAYLLGKLGADELRFRPERFFADQVIRLRHDRAVRIDRVSKTIRLAAGEALSYGHLVLATGARNRPLDVAGTHAESVHGLRTLADADRLSAALREARRAIVVGAGFIGMEFAAVAADRGLVVNVIELSGRVMSRSLSAETSRLFEAAHRQAGTQFHFGESIVAIEERDGKVAGVRTAVSGQIIEAELLVLGIGVLPNTMLAQDAGLAVGNGIVVDANLLTSDPAISAIGDCACFPNPQDGSPTRLESVQTAFDQARFVAERLTGATASYTAIPWFWSDQGSLKLQIVGSMAQCDMVVTAGAETSAPLSVLGFCRGRLTAVESVNAPADHLSARRALARLDPGLTIEMAAAPGFSLKAWEAATRKLAPT